MKKLLLSVFGICAATILSAQTYPYVDVNQIMFDSPMDLQNCVDVSAYDGDTVRTRGIVIIDGNLSEVASGSIAGGSRPFISIMDTAARATGISGPFQSVAIMGVFSGAPVTNVENALAGDIIEITAVVNEFNGMVQLEPISANAVSFVGITSAPNPKVVQVRDLQNNMQQNVLTTGEQYEAAYVEIQNVTVTSVSNFTAGRQRTEFVVQDANGNRMLVADRFLPMINAGQPTVNPNSPDTVGSFVAPAIGTVYNYIRGMIFQDENGTCYPNASGFAGGYEINPFNSTDFDKAASPANISGVTRNPLVPNASQSVTVTADIIDFDGVVTSANLYYTTDKNAAANTFTQVNMSNTSGSIYTATIPAQPLDSLVRYYLVAVDDSSNVTVFPNTPIGAPLNTEFYTVRANGATIMDIQFTPNANGESPLNGDTVSVTGIVTASYQTGDLGYLYIQDPTANENAGIFVNGGPASIFSLNRGDQVRVVGVVEESFGFTRINALADSVVATGSTGVITPVTLNPSDSSLFAQGSRELEKYESMLLRYANPAMGGQIFVTNSNLGFGDYLVGTFGSTYGARILAGRQVFGQAQGSLDVSYVSDTAAFSSSMNVTPIQVNGNYSFDAIEGILYYAFGNYKLTPRNNSDFSNVTVGIENISSSSVNTMIYPNPADNNVVVKIDDRYNFQQVNIQLFDLTGRLVLETKTSSALSNLTIANLDRGMYMVRISNNNEIIHTSKLILK